MMNPINKYAVYVGPTVTHETEANRRFEYFSGASPLTCCSVQIIKAFK